MYKILMISEFVYISINYFDIISIYFPGNKNNEEKGSSIT